MSSPINSRQIESIDLLSSWRFLNSRFLFVITSIVIAQACMTSLWHYSGFSKNIMPQNLKDKSSWELGMEVSRDAAVCCPVNGLHKTSYLFLPWRVSNQMLTRLSLWKTSLIWCAWFLPWKVWLRESLENCTGSIPCLNACITLFFLLKEGNSGRASNRFHTM